MSDFLLRGAPDRSVAMSDWALGRSGRSRAGDTTPTTPDGRRDPGLGCLLVLVVVVGFPLTSWIAIQAYTSVGVSQIAGRAQARLDLIDGTLRRLPLSSVTVRYDDREPADRQQAATAVKAQRLGPASWLFFCGDACPSWNPGDPVEIFRSETLSQTQTPTANSCDQVGRLLRSVAGLREVPPGSWVSGRPFCSFAGCINGVGVRADFFGPEAAALDGVELRGMIGTPRFASSYAPPACPPGR
jgi:hypothetical protein